METVGKPQYIHSLYLIWRKSENKLTPITRKKIHFRQKLNFFTWLNLCTASKTKGGFGGFFVVYCFYSFISSKIFIPRIQNIIIKNASGVYEIKFENPWRTVARSLLFSHITCYWCLVKNLPPNLDVRSVFKSKYIYSIPDQKSLVHLVNLQQFLYSAERKSLSPPAWPPHDAMTRRNGYWLQEHSWWNNWICIYKT